MRLKSTMVVVVSVAVLMLAAPLSPGLASGRPIGSASLAATSPPGVVTAPAGVGLASSAAAMIRAHAASVASDPAFPRAAGLEPNLAYRSVREGTAIVPANLATGQVSPGPTSIGVNDLGLRAKPGGKLVPYWYRTTSIDGTVAINNLSLLPVETNASDAITVQENAVLNNVTLFGESDVQIWSQNVIFYSLVNHQLQLVTDAWNFTGPPFALFQNDIYENSPGGFLFTGVYVHQVPVTPPALTVRLPFTIRLYLNATNVDGRNALYFNYTLYSGHDIYLNGTDLGNRINDGSFDWIIFNSTAGQPTGYSAPPASFLISGNESTNLGLANDAEIAVCGPSDGFGAVVRSLTGTAQLLYLNGTTGRYSAVPAAFTTTEDTGETVEGVDAHFTGAQAAQGEASLSAGPEFVYGLWNATAASVHEQRYTVSLLPAATQLWVSPNLGGANAGFSNDSAAWALAPSDRVTFWLPTGPGETFSAAALANNYDPAYGTLSPGGANSFDLKFDRAQGVYVPIIAFGNAGVASIALWGAGTTFDPYEIYYRQTQPISSLYDVYEDFAEPLYPGLLFSGVTAHVVILHPPSLQVAQSSSAVFILQFVWGLNPPSTNDLPMEIYDSSNVTILGASDISGWFPVMFSGFLMASLFLSDDSHTLIANNHFSSMGSSMAIVSTSGAKTREDNTVFGNTFAVSPVEHGPNASSLYVILAFNSTYTGPPTAGALGVFSSGNTIYNNVFDTPITAYSTPQNPYLAYVFVNDLGYADFREVAAHYANAWNISLEPITYVNWVNGVPLFGSIVGASFQGGNFWKNYNGTAPYTDGGLIVGGGDDLPLP